MTEAESYEMALNTIRDCAFMARNLRPRSKRALDYIERFASERLERLGAAPSLGEQPINMLRTAKVRKAKP